MGGVQSVNFVSEFRTTLDRDHVAKIFLERKMGARGRGRNSNSRDLHMQQAAVQQYDGSKWVK